MKRATTLLLGLFILLVEQDRAFAQGAEAQPVAALAGRQLLSAAAFPGLPPGEPVKCGLGIYAYATRNWPILSQELRTAYARVMQRDQRQKAISSGHFTIHYDTLGPAAAAMLDAAYQPIPGSSNEFADSVAAVAERVYNFEVVELGYTAPPGDGSLGGGPSYDIYVENLVDLGGRPYYGETVPETALDTKSDGGRYIAFMRVHNDFTFVHPNGNKGLPGLRVTLAHEFHHMIQMGSYAFWGARDIFFHEITSTWMEDVVFPGVNDYLNYVRSSLGHFRNPDESFALADGLIEYSRAIWGHFIAAKFGRDVMRAIWQHAMNARPLEATDRALQALPTNPSNFRIEFIDWALWNYYTGPRADSTKYYPKGAIYPEIAQLPYEFVAPTGLLSGTLEPLSARYHQVITSVDTVLLIQTNVNRESADQEPVTTYSYTISLNATQPDESYDQAGNILWFKPSVADPSNWKTLKIVQGVASIAGIAEGVPFPNPFRATGNDVVFIPAVADHGTLNIYSSSMDLIYDATQTPAKSSLGKPVFTWNGNANDNRPAKSGIYIFVLSIPGKILTGKIALIRN